MNAAAVAARQRTTEIAARCRIDPVVIDDVCPDLCPALAEVILHRMQTDRRRTASLNVGGWKSTEDFFSWPDEPVQRLRGRIVAELGASRPFAWAMVNRSGSHHPRHQHMNAKLVGVYYVIAGDPIVPTVFETKEGDVEVEPHPGRLVLCPGTMWHRVPIYPGDKPRITIAFDVRR